MSALRPRRVLAIGLVAGLFATVAGIGGETASARTNELFPGAQVVTDMQLDNLRGGFSVPSMPNVSFNFGITVTTSVSSIPDIPDMPDVPEVTVETNIMFDDNGLEPNVPTTGTVSSITKVNGQTYEQTSHSGVDLSNTSFGTQTTVKVSGDNVNIESGSGFGGVGDSLGAPDVGLPETPDLVLLNSFSSSLVASIIANSLNGLAITQTTALNIDVNGYENFQKTMPGVGTLNALRSIDNSMIMSLTR